MKQTAIAIIDLSTSTLTIIDVPDHWDSERTEEHLTDQGFSLTNCSWGEFDGDIHDQRGEDVGPPEMYIGD